MKNKNKNKNENKKLRTFKVTYGKSLNFPRGEVLNITVLVVAKKKRHALEVAAEILSGDPGWLDEYQDVEPSIVEK